MMAAVFVIDLPVPGRRRRPDCEPGRCAAQAAIGQKWPC